MSEQSFKPSKLTRIKIEDLPEGKKISREEMKRVLGGSFNPYFSVFSTSYYTSIQPARYFSALPLAQFD